MSNKKQEIGYIGLILLNGGRIEIKYPDDRFDDFYDELLDAIRNSDLFFVGNWDGISAMYKGNKLNCINCNLVVGCWY